MNKNKHKLKIELVYWKNKHDSYNGYTSLNGQQFKFFNLNKEEALKKLVNDTKFLCEEVKRENEEATS